MGGWGWDERQPWGSTRSSPGRPASSIPTRGSSRAHTLLSEQARNGNRSQQATLSAREKRERHQSHTNAPVATESSAGTGPRPTSTSRSSNTASMWSPAGSRWGKWVGLNVSGGRARPTRFPLRAHHFFVFSAGRLALRSAAAGARRVQEEDGTAACWLTTSLRVVGWRRQMNTKKVGGSPLTPAPFPLRLLLRSRTLRSGQTPRPPPCQPPSPPLKPG
jgi:hypothetical protein